LPAASELTMLYGGALAAGAFAHAHVNAFGHRVHGHASAYAVIALAGIAGNLVGALAGWLSGRYAGVEVARRARFLHITPARVARAEGGLDRFGRVAVPVGFMSTASCSVGAIAGG